MGEEVKPRSVTFSVDKSDFEELANIESSIVPKLAKDYAKAVDAILFCKLKTFCHILDIPFPLVVPMTSDAALAFKYDMIFNLGIEFRADTHTTRPLSFEDQFTVKYKTAFQYKRYGEWFDF